MGEPTLVGTAAWAILLPLGLMILLGTIGYLFSQGHPASLDRGLFAGLLLGIVYGLYRSWGHGRRFVAVHLVLAAIALWSWIAWNPIYQVYVAQDPLDARLEPIDRRPN